MEKTSNETADEFAIWEVPVGKDPVPDFGLAQEDDGPIPQKAPKNASMEVEYAENATCSATRNYFKTQPTGFQGILKLAVKLGLAMLFGSTPSLIGTANKSLHAWLGGIKGF